MFGSSLDILPFSEMEPLVEKLKVAGAEILMLKPRIDQINDSLIQTAFIISEKYELKIFFHPFERDTAGRWYVANDSDDMKLMAAKYRILFEGIRDCNFYHLFIVHPGRLSAEGAVIRGKERADGGDAAFYTAQFLKLLQKIIGEVMGDAAHNITLALENMPWPGRNKGEEPWGYQRTQLDAFVQHFTNGHKNGIYPTSLKICLDMGHANLSRGSFFANSYRRLPIACVHLHTNDGTDDGHELPYLERVRPENNPRFLLKDEKVVKVLEVRMDILKGTKPAELTRIFETLKQGALPRVRHAR